MEQMMEGLLAKMDVNLKEIKACQEHPKEEIRVGLELQKEKMLVKLDVHHERMMVKVDFQLEKMEASLEKTEATYLEANPEEIKSKSELQEVPNEEATLETIGAQED
jgi:hypothetical protein